MKVQTGLAASRELRVTIELDETAVEAALRDAAAQAAQTIKIPGFRKAKVPYRVIERYVGRPALLAQVHERLAQETIQTYLRKNDVGNTENAAVESIQDDPVTYVFQLALEPYTSLGDCSALRVKPRALELTEEEREEEKIRLQGRFAVPQEVEEAADWQDEVTLNVKSVILDEEANVTDEVILEEEGWQVVLEKEEMLQPPGLEREIIGLTPGQAKTFDLAYPEDSASVYAGKHARFDLRVVTVKRHVNPEWDAKLLARALNDTGDEGAERPLAEYEEVFWNRLNHERARRIFQEELDEAFGALEEMSILEYSRFSVDAQVDFLVSQRRRELERMGLRNFETYLHYTQQTLADFRKSLEPEATTILKQNLLIWDFIERNKIEISADQQERLERQAAEQAAHMMNSDIGQREGVTLEGITASLLQHSMSETLGYLGRNALLEMCTEGVHSMVQYDEKLPVMELATRVSNEEEEESSDPSAPMAEFDIAQDAA